MFSVSKNLLTILPFLWKAKSVKHKWSVILTLILVFMTIALNLSVPLFFKKIVNSLADPSDINHQLTFLLLISYGICWASGRFFEKIREMVFFKPVSTAITDYCLAVFKHILSLSLKFHLNRETGKVAGAIQGSQLAISMILTNIFFRIIPVFIEALLAFFILWHFVGIEIGLIVIAILVGYLIMNYFIMNVFKKADKLYEDIDIVVDKHVIDSLLNSENIKYLGAEDFESSQVNKLLRKREDAIINVFWTGTFTTTVQALLLGTGLTLISYMVGKHVLSGDLKIGDFVLVNGYLLMLFNPLESITGFIRNTISHSAQLNHSTLLLNESHIIKDMPDASDIKINQAQIKFEQVAFGYTPNTRPILQNFTLTIPDKKTIAIVGPSGSGKSTLARLIFRFYDVSSGAILIDNQDIKTITKNSLRKHIAVVPQDIILLNKSLKYNITYGNFNASSQEINQVIQAVHLENLITKLPDGLDTLVGERGVKLSGGEKQRIGIARALLKNPKILMFDEATSSLDTQTEKIVQKNIEEITQNITTILIAHRLSTVIHADMIVVLDKGVIIEKGTHSELLAKKGLYATLWGEQHDKK
jgi:ABC-type transport system involved in Fe-S cluster assembly fused permease/ATPase subunit